MDLAKGLEGIQHARISFLFSSFLNSVRLMEEKGENEEEGVCVFPPSGPSANTKLVIFFSAH